MKYILGQTYLKYIESNVNAINSPNSPKYKWKTTKKQKPFKIINDAINKYSDFAKVADGIGNDYITRDDVAEYYDTDLYKGFITTLLWGGYHKGRYNKGKEGRFFEIISINKSTVIERIKDVKSLLQENKLSEAFESMLCGNNHIQGIGLSYMTKILYFLSHNIDINPKPLIYDSVAQKIHCAILIDELKDGVKEWYYMRNNVLCLRKSYYEMYEKYINDMDALATKYGIISSDRLEEALFGDNRRKINENPRMVVCKYLNKHKYLLQKTKKWNDVISK